MNSFRILAAVSAAAAAGGLALPALAQSPYPYAQPYPQAYPQAYPQSGYAYPGQPGYAAPNSVGAIINQLLGNRYSVNDRTAVTQCATAAQAQAAAQYRPNRGRQQGYGGYNGYNGYSAYSMARVTGITSVQRRSNGVRVSGLMDSGTRGGHGGYDPAYANAASDLTFRCNVDYRGVVTNVRVRQNNVYRG